MTNKIDKLSDERLCAIFHLKESPSADELEFIQNAVEFVSEAGLGASRMAMAEAAIANEKRSEIAEALALMALVKSGNLVVEQKRPLVVS